MISHTGDWFYGSNDPTNNVKVPKEVVVLRTRIQSKKQSRFKSPAVHSWTTLHLQNDWLHAARKKHSIQLSVMHMLNVYQVCGDVRCTAKNGSWS